MEVKTVVINGHALTCQRIENNINLDPGAGRGDTKEIIQTTTTNEHQKTIARCHPGEGRDPEIPTNLTHESSIYSVTLNETSHNITASFIAYDAIKKEARFLINNRVVNVTGITGSLSDQMHFFIEHQQITCALPHVITPHKQSHDQAHKNCVTKVYDAQPPHLVSPLAGRVIRLLVQQGDTVVRGQPLVVVESMKMENELCAPHNAFIKTISIAPGNLVQTNQVLITFELKGEFDATTKDRHGQATVSDW